MRALAVTLGLHMEAQRTDGYLTKQAAAHYLSVSTRTIENLIARGELPAFKPTINGTRSRKVLFRRTDLDAWIERFRVAPDIDRLVDETLASLATA
jgi:excisionase family DNA binding protein